MLEATNIEKIAIAIAGYADAASMLDAPSYNEFLTALRSRWEPRGFVVLQDVSLAWDEIIGF